MVRGTSKFIIPIAIILIVVVSIIIVSTKGNDPTTEQSTPTATPTTEQISEPDNPDVPIQPDINTQEFKLMSANITCSSPSVCTGSIKVIPRAQSDMEPGLYKINEQTTLSKAGVQQDLSSLQELASSEPYVRLKLADGGEDTLAEVKY